MEKTAIKNYAIWARRKLKEDIATRAGFLGITENGIRKPLEASTREIQYFDIGADKPVNIRGKEIGQRENLVKKLIAAADRTDYRQTYEQLIETSAYDWFNRLIAIRYMEVNGYEPLDVRLLSSIEDGKQDPDLVTTPFDGSLEYTEEERKQIIEWKSRNESEKLFRFLLLKMCNELHTALPGIFQQQGDYSELLMWFSFVDKDGVLYRLVHDIPEDDWKDQVQIIGWIYQYYNTELKDETFALLKKNVKITRERIPSATQLFTPDWIVRYMVENSLGRLWLEGHPDDSLKSNWRYYLDEAPQEPEVEAQLAEIRKEYAKLEPEDLKCIDPCMGSGHILVYMFDVLMQIYVSVGYSEREAAKSILEHNLYGLDIDDRAYQLAYFAVMMKARKHNRRILSSGIKPHVYAIEESNSVDKETVKYFCNGDEKLEAALDTILAELEDAKEYGSILNVTPQDWDTIRARVGEIEEDTSSVFRKPALEVLLPVLQVAETLERRYWITCTNPPYMGSKNINIKLLNYIQRNYPAGKADIYGAFILRCRQFDIKSGMLGFITPYVWMYLLGFEILRNILIDTVGITSLVQLEYNAFEVACVPVCIFTLRNSSQDYIGRYIQLSSFRGWENQEPKTLAAIDDFSLNYCYEAKQSRFKALAGAPIAYWLDKSMYKAFENGIPLESYGTPKQGMATADNNRFMRRWFEVKLADIDFHCMNVNHTIKKWYPHSKGGSLRRWYGNNEYVINWKNNGSDIRSFEKAVVRNPDYYFKEGITWSDLTVSWFTARRVPIGFTFDSAGPTFFAYDNSNLNYICGYFNSWVFQEFLNISCQGMHYSNGVLAKLPIIWGTQEQVNEISMLAETCIKISKCDWDESELSWEFKKHPLVSKSLSGEHSVISKRITTFLETLATRKLRLEMNEIRINKLFAKIYKMEHIMPSKGLCPPTLKDSNTRNEIIGFISYAVGCMFGRYSLDVEGLAYAGGVWDKNSYTSFLPDRDNMIPLTEKKYVENDMVERFCEFLKVVYGENSLEKNLDFIAGALGGKGTSSRGIIRNYFLNGFYKDHCSIYQKRPIYWLYDSGKQNGFKALTYMHRMDENTTARAELYLQDIQKRYETEIRSIDTLLDHITDARQIGVEEKRREHLRRQVEEIREYDERLEHMANEHISLDLDDGVKRNYEKLQTDRNGVMYQILAPIK